MTAAEADDVAGLVRAYVGAPMTGEGLARRIALWDRDDPGVVLVPEESPVALIGWPAIEGYWARSRGGLRDHASTLDGLTVRLLAPDVAVAAYTMTWRATFDGGLYDGLEVAGDNRVASWWRRAGAGWRLFHLIEAPLSPLRAIRLAAQRAYREG